jgi:deoxyribodipyrimidine photo-lyase
MNREKETITCVWLKKDLRLQDNRCLLEASQLAESEGYPILAFYILEKDYWKSEKASSCQKTFILQSLNNLNQNLKKIGGEVHLLEENSAVEALQSLQKVFDIHLLLSHLETGNDWTYQRDKKVHALTKSLNIPWKEIAQHPITRGQNPFAPELFLPACPSPKSWKNPKTSIPLKIEISPNPANQNTQIGGEDHALQLLNSFLTQRCLSHQGYRKSLGNPLEAPSACSRLSPHLTWGTISQKTLTRKIDKVLAHKASPNLQKQIQAFEDRLKWRNSFLQSFEKNCRMEYQCLNPKTEHLRGWNEELFQRWAHGQTGYPFVDACMRSLRENKWLHFRGRALITSFAAFVLNLDWRGFGPHLAQNFLDYEPGIHYWQLQLQSGTSLSSTLRIYNPLKQSLDKDPEGKFIRKWVPEIAHLSNSQIHLPLNPPKGYPKAIVPLESLHHSIKLNSPKTSTPKTNEQLELFQL